MPTPAPHQLGSPEELIRYFLTDNPFAALLVDPHEPAAIAEGIERVLADAALARALTAKGLARAARFSWEASIRRVREIYDEVARVDGTRGDIRAGL